MSDHDLNDDLGDLSLDLASTRELSSKRSSKNASPVWKYAFKFSKPINGLKTFYYKCNYDSCQHEAKFAGTANIAAHLRTHGLILEAQPVESEIVSNNDQLNVNKVNLINSLLLSFIITSFSPFEIVENFHLKRILQMLNPKYKLPCSKTVANSLLDIRYNEIVKKIKKDLEKVDCLCVTTDNWTSVQDFGYIGVTIHYIDENFVLRSNTISTEHINGSHSASVLLNTLYEIFQKWQIVEKVNIFSLIFILDFFIQDYK